MEGKWELAAGVLEEILTNYYDNSKIHKNKENLNKVGFVSQIVRAANTYRKLNDFEIAAGYLDRAREMLDRIYFPEFKDAPDPSRQISNTTKDTMPDDGEESNKVNHYYASLYKARGKLL
jgi:hypothetical protein